MNALASSNLSFESINANGICQLHAKPSAAGGPVTLFFDVSATHPGAESEHIFAAAATLSQQGRLLASFKAVAHDTLLHGLPDWWNDSHKEYIPTYEKLPHLGDSYQLKQAFGLFYTMCWQFTWEALHEHIPLSGNGYRSPDKLMSNGHFQVVHNGLLNHVERLFFHSSQLDGADKEAIHGDKAYFISLCHPYGIHPLCSLLVAMGYAPGIIDGKDAYTALGLSYNYRDLEIDTANLTALYWAAKTNDPRLAPFKL